MTADGPVGYYLSRLYKTKWFSSDTEQEAGCGIVPIEYKNTSLIHAWQWAIGLEWYLLVNDPWRVVMSTDHPNGGSFLAYPADHPPADGPDLPPGHARDRAGRRARADACSGTSTASTRCRRSPSSPGPARRGCSASKNKGHLGAGCRCRHHDLHARPERETMFELPRFVIKAGRVIVEQGEIREDIYGKTLHVAPEYDRDVEPDIERWFETSYSIRWRNYPVDDDLHRANREVIACILTHRQRIHR